MKDSNVDGRIESSVAALHSYLNKGYVLYGTLPLIFIRIEAV